MRIAAADVGNDSIKVIFEELEYELNISNIVARDTEDHPIIGVKELNNKNPLDGIHIMNI